VAGHPSLNQEDGIHPTAAGHEVMAENVWLVLEDVLLVRTPPR
jgi:acyl-CoA thioesterase-1